jgi:5'-deoxynucleotidase YfbR-like HD superfamily hydrolase
MSGFDTGNKLQFGPNGEKLTRTSLITHSLHTIDLAAPCAEDVYLSDIAHGLSMHVRWAGQGSWLSVAQHSVMVMRYIEAEGDRLDLGTDKGLLSAALLHDAHEAYIGDLSGGLKYMLRYSELPSLIISIDRAIGEKMGVQMAHGFQDVERAIDRAEQDLITEEYGFLFRNLDSPWIEGGMCNKMAEGLFLSEAARLGMVDDVDR